MNAQEAQDRKPGLMARAYAGVQQFIAEDRKKWGGMTLGGMARLGLAEFREAFSWPGGSIAQPTPYGMYGTLTPGEVSSARDPQAPQMEEEAPMNGKQHTPSPSEIARNPSAYLPQQGNGRGPEHGQDRMQGQGHASVHGERDPTPSPSEIARNPSAYLPQRDGHEQQHDHDHGRE